MYLSLFSTNCNKSEKGNLFMGVNKHMKLTHVKEFVRLDLKALLFFQSRPPPLILQGLSDTK